MRRTRYVQLERERITLRTVRYQIIKKYTNPAVGIGIYATREVSRVRFELSRSLLDSSLTVGKHERDRSRDLRDVIDKV